MFTSSTKDRHFYDTTKHTRLLSQIQNQKEAYLIRASLQKSAYEILHDNKIYSKNLLGSVW